MNKYRVEFGFGENFLSVDEWQVIMDEASACSSEEAAINASYTDGLDGALFRVYKLSENDFGELEPVEPHNPEYFSF